MCGRIPVHQTERGTKMTNPTTAQELQELFGKVDWEKVFKDELAAEVKKQLDYNMSIILYGNFGDEE